MTPRTAALAAALAAFAAAQAAMAASPTPAPVAAPSASSTPMALTLAQAENIALASSPVLALARGQLVQAQGGIGVARSGELPDLSGSASTARAKTVTPSGTFGPVTTKSASITLRQLLIDGGRIHDAVEAARLGSDAATRNLERQAQTVEFGVAQSYYAALQARHQLQVAQDSLHLAQVQERLVDAQYKAGVASKADVLTAQLPVAQAQLAVAQAANGEQTQLALMLDAMGLPAQTSVTIADESPAPAAIPALADVLSAANRQRPDLLAAQANSDAAAANLRSARLGLFPAVSASGESSTTSQASSSYAPGWSAGVAVSIPLFDGGLTRAQTAVARGQADQASANLTSAQLLVSLNVQQSYLALQTAQAGLTAADAEYAQARTVLDVTNAQYRAGVTTLPLLLNAQVGLAKAESDRVNAVYAYKTAWQQLLLSEGTIGR